MASSSRYAVSSVESKTTYHRTKTGANKEYFRRYHRGDRETTIDDLQTGQRVKQSTSKIVSPSKRGSYTFSGGEYKRNSSDLAQEAWAAGRDWFRTGQHSSGVANARVVKYGYSKWWNNQSPQKTAGHSKGGKLERAFREGWNRAKMSARTVNPGGTRYRGVISAIPGHLLRGGKKQVKSSWFNSKKEAHDWVYAMEQPGVETHHIERGAPYESAVGHYYFDKSRTAHGPFKTKKERVAHQRSTNPKKATYLVFPDRDEKGVPQFFSSTLAAKRYAGPLANKLGHGVFVYKENLNTGLMTRVDTVHPYSRPRFGAKFYMKNPGGPLDTHAAKELELFVENDADLYRQQYTPINKNLITKMARGVYNHDKAVKLFGYLMESGAKKYARQYSGGSDWHQIFSPATRKSVAELFARHFEVEAKLGNYDALLPKKYSDWRLKKNPNRLVDVIVRQNGKTFKAKAKYDAVQRRVRVFVNPKVAQAINPRGPRKTRDYYSIEGYYAGGWEEVTEESTWREARQRLKEYRENEPGTSFRARRRREKIEAA